MEIPVSREQFEELTADLLERTAYTTRQLLAAAGMEWKDISRVLLVGGSTRMPMVVEMLRKLSGMEPDHTVHPDEAVARGAALYAAYLLAKESGDEDRASFTDHQRQLAQPGRRGDRPGNAAEAERRADSAEHAAAGQVHRAVRHPARQPAVDRAAGARRRERACRASVRPSGGP